MRRIPTLSFRSRVLLVALVPLSAVVILGSLGTWARYERARELSGIRRLVGVSAEISELVHELQKERGRTAGYLGFRGAQFGPELTDQRQATDEAYAKFDRFLADRFPVGRSELGVQGAASLHDAMALLARLPDVRQAASNQTLSVGNAITYYSDVTRSFLNVISALPELTQDGGVANAISAYSNFLQLKETTGIERAILANTFARDEFSEGMFIRFVSLLGARAAYERAFECSATPAGVEYYRRTVTGPDVDQAAHWEQLALGGPAPGGFAVSATRWFDVMTAKIDLQKEVEDHLAASLNAAAGSAINAANAARNGYAAITIAAVLISAGVAGWMARRIVESVQHLSNTVQKVAAGPNYALRAAKISNDEIGDLVDGFNAMLGQIQERDEQLLLHQNHLEQLVTERTALSALTAEVALAVTRHDHPQAVLQRCTEAIIRHLDAAFARIWTLNEKEQVLELQASAGLYTHLDGAHSRVKVGELKIGKIAFERKPHLTNQVVGDPRVGDQAWARREGMVAFAGYPLIVGERLVGVMAMFARQALDQSALDALSVVADSIALGIERFDSEQGLLKAREAKAMAEAASRAKSAFLARMSHEIRTPLNSILGFTELLRRRSGTEDQRSNYVETIHSSGRYLAGLIDDILDLSKIEAGRMEFERVRCSPHQVISEVLSVLRVRAQEKRLRLECRWTSGMPETILTDPAALKQLLINLVGNAIKFTERGGVHLLARAAPHSPEPRFEIEIHDSGIGIPVDRIEGIFTPFEQADSSITRRFGGTGLGLAICRHIAEALGGNITVESREGAGSVFRVTLETGPLDDVAMLGAPPSESLESRDKVSAGEIASLRTVRVLLVEDGETNRQLICAVLEEAGAEVVCAENGRLGMEAEACGQFNLILMDMQMPVMDGYTATRKLRERGCQLPIVALTAHAMRGDREECLAAGCSGYLPKPINLDQLLRTVAIAAARSRRGPQFPSGGNRDEPAPSIAVSGDESISSTLMRDHPQFRGIVEAFVERLPSRLEEMRALYARSDLDALAELAHWLKGTGGTMGFGCFTEPALRLESQARQRRVQEIEASIEELERLADQLVVAT